jgi:hypothetical protein
VHVLGSAVGLPAQVAAAPRERLFAFGIEDDV